MEQVLVEISVEKKRVLQRAVPSLKMAVGWETIQSLKPGATQISLGMGVYQLARRYGSVPLTTFRVQSNRRVVSVLNDAPPGGIREVHDD